REAISLPPDSWALDALPDRSGSLWIAIGPVPRQGPARLARVVAGTEIVWREIPGSNAAGDLHLVPRRRAPPFIVSASGAWTASPGGGATRIATWSVDGYGFYAATARARADGGLTVLAPTFDTCGSADVLEALVELRAGGRRLTTRRWTGRRLGHRTPALAADGSIYRWFRDAGGACTLETASDASSATRGEACDVLVRHNGERTVAVVDDGGVVRLVRRKPGAPSRIDLGHLERTEHAVDVTPDHRGGALVLTADGRVVRFSGGTGLVLPI
ncbi:MAG TPA: hypothetical protein VK698_26415, partial [Kofleriaceae bacterium]|nr:hypothetical protein [Kofleriaceae bacterium]